VDVSAPPSPYIALEYVDGGTLADHVGKPVAPRSAVRLHEPVPPNRLQARLHRDLNTICLRCLEKAPGRRYASAAALADDLEAWLDGRPVAARPVGPVGRAAKWARRRPAVAALLAAVVLLTVTGAAGVT
jgi:hypothetical protein